MVNRKRKTIVYDVQVGTLDNPLWRAWGYSLELDTFEHRPSNYCDFCKTKTGRFFKTKCHCGLSGARKISDSGLRISYSWSPENGDLTFYSCEKCTNRLADLIEAQDRSLLNHEILHEIIQKL